MPSRLAQIDEIDAPFVNPWWKNRLDLTPSDLEEFPITDDLPVLMDEGADQMIQEERAPEVVLAPAEPENGRGEILRALGELQTWLHGLRGQIEAGGSPDVAVEFEDYLLWADATLGTVQADAATFGADVEARFHQLRLWIAEMFHRVEAFIAQVQTRPIPSTLPEIGETFPAAFTAGMHTWQGRLAGRGVGQFEDVAWYDEPVYDAGGGYVYADDPYAWESEPTYDLGDGGIVYEEPAGGWTPTVADGTDWRAIVGVIGTVATAGATVARSVADVLRSAEGASAPTAGAVWPVGQAVPAGYRRNPVTGRLERLSAVAAPAAGGLLSGGLVPLLVLGGGALLLLTGKK